MNRLKGKTAFITGATAGIGKATAQALADMGVNLILTGRRETLLKEIKEKIESEYEVKVHTVKMDVSKIEEVVKGIESLPESFKKIDILLNNAGLALGMNKAFENEYEDLDQVIDTNVKGMMYVTKAVVPYILENGSGHIINLGSTAGDAAYAGGAVYCASKAAVKAFTDGLRIDLIDKPVKVTNIKPGMVETDFSVIRFKGDEEKAKNVYKGIEALTAADVAEVIINVLNLPENVQVAELTLMPLYQADGRTTYRK